MSILALVLAIITGCSATPTALSALRERHDAATVLRPYGSLVDLLGNREYVNGQGDPRPLTVAVVVGTFGDVSEGLGFVVEGKDAPAGTPVAYADGSALWRTQHVDFQVQEVLSGQVADNDIRVGLSFGDRTPSVNTTESELRAMGKVVLFLEKTAVFAYDPSVYSIVESGAMMAPISDKGQLSVPVLPADEAADFLAPADSLAELREAAARPTVVVR